MLERGPLLQHDVWELPLMWMLIYRNQYDAFLRGRRHARAHRAPHARYSNVNKAVVIRRLTGGAKPEQCPGRVVEAVSGALSP